MLTKLWNYFSGMNWVGLVFFRSRKVWPSLGLGSPDGEDNDVRISGTDRRLLQLMATEWDDRDIAAELGVSVITVGERRKTVIRKMGVRTSKEAVRLARRRNLIN